MQLSTQTAVRNSAEEAHNIIDDTMANRRLWLAVVAQAVEDWKSGTLRVRRVAQSFIFEPSKDFETVCANAGLDAGHLRSKLRKLGRMVDADSPIPCYRIAA